MIPETAESTPPTRLGRYELLGRLATGGMAEIYLARLAGEAGFEKIVVVKRLHPALAAADDYVRMFLDEGKLVARLDHPNVCEVHELGRDGSDYFLAMPFLDGVAVTDLISRARDPNRIAQLRIAAGVVVQACAGLHHAHELRGADGASLGLVHRDASPSNLFVTTSGIVKVLDFGIAKVRGAQATEIGVIKGKWQYMAPEQVLGEELDRRCDVFALGIVLYELATHQRLFKRDSEFLAARAVLEEPIPRADDVDPAVPRVLADVIAQALARDKAARYADARELAQAIDAAMAAHGGIATAPEIAAALAAEHAEELTAQRTRRLRVVERARDGGVSAVATMRRAIDTDASSRERDGTGRSNVVEAPAGDRIDGPPRDRIVTAATPAATSVAHLPSGESARDAIARRAGSRRTIVAILATMTLAAGAIVAIVVAMVPSDDSMRPAASSSTSAKPPVATTPLAGDPDSSSGAPARPRGDETHDTDRRSADQPAARMPGGDIDMLGSDAPVREVELPPARVGTRPAPAKPGQLSIDSAPYATIFIDGRSLGVTPILHQTLPAGKRRIRAVLRDGRSKEWTVEIPSGRTAPPINLTW